MAVVVSSMLTACGQAPRAVTSGAAEGASSYVGASSGLDSVPHHRCHYTAEDSIRVEELTGYLGNVLESLGADGVESVQEILEQLNRINLKIIDFINC